jgi:5-carboxymethyl-2-hydroxymuconate isomerase
MPHVTIQYTANLDPDARIDALCASLAEVILRAARRRRARALPHRRHAGLGLSVVRPYAVADGAPDRAFCYVNVRIATGRPRDRVQATARRSVRR